MKFTWLAAISLFGCPLLLQAQPSATMRPSLLATTSLGFAYSSNEELTYQDAPLGSIAVRHFALSYAHRHTVNDHGTFLYGFAYNTHELDSTGVLLPARLSELSLNLGWQKTLNPEWSMGVYLRPGFYGDFEEFSGNSINAPAMFLANYSKSRELAWSFGINANLFSDNPVLPVAGVRWQFAPRWNFSIGYPRSGFAWQATDAVTLRTGVGFQGGSFRVTQNLGVPKPGIARLSNTLLDYREVQVGVGADIKVDEVVTLVLDFGAVTDRKFDYFDRDYRLDGDAGYYFAISLRGAF